MKRLIIICAVGSLLVVGNFAQAGGPVFSLDDNPAVPLTTGPGPIPGFGAEDPYGLGTYGAPGVAPSPSLIVGPFMDSDLLESGRPVAGVPILHHFTPNGNWINALSDGTKVYYDDIKLDFSVDRISLGAPGTAVNTQFNRNQQPGDIFRTTRSLPSPGQFVGTLPPGVGYAGPLPHVGLGGGNNLVVDESALTLTPGLGPGNLIGPAVMAPPIGPGTHDNVDSFEWNAFDINGDLLNDRWMYFSIYPDEAVLVQTSAADIYDVAPQGGGTSPTPFAPSITLGLDLVGGLNSDDIDGLIVWDLNLLGGSMWGGPGAQPGIDYALFSLSHGSVSLAQWGLSEADIFFTDFSGSFALYANAADLGLIGGPGSSPGDNVDALEIIPEPATIALLGLGALSLLRIRRKRSV